MVLNVISPKFITIMAEYNFIIRAIIVNITEKYVDKERNKEK